MKMVLSHFNYWCKANSEQQMKHAQLAMLPPESKSPQLDWVPAMQRRRLSHYAKMALSVAANSANNSEYREMPVVFASQHGDFHRTSKIIKNLALEEALSPTSFGLSVHNAVIGLYSIFTKNQAAMTSISAGENSLLMAIIEAYSQLQQNTADHVLVVYCDQPLPQDYSQFAKYTSCDLACAFVLSRQSEQGINITLSPSESVNDTAHQARQFVEFIANRTKEHSFILGERTGWQVSVSGANLC